MHAAFMLYKTLGYPELMQSLRQGITEKHTVEYNTKGYCYYVRVPEWEKKKAANKPWNKRRTEYLAFKNKQG